MGLYDSKMSCWMRRMVGLPQDNCGDVCIDTELAAQKSATQVTENDPIVTPPAPAPVKPIYTPGTAKAEQASSTSEK